MLIVKNLTLSLNGEPLLRNVDFSVAPGEILTLMGPSGSGKSTLFAWMVGALAENFRAAGELWLDNQRCDSLPTERRRIGILFQDALLFDHFSVGQNLLLTLAADVRGPQRIARNFLTAWTRLSFLPSSAARKFRPSPGACWNVWESV